MSYILRQTLVHIGIEGGSTAGPRDNERHINIFSLFFVSQIELVNGVRK